MIKTLLYRKRAHSRRVIVFNQEARTTAFSSVADSFLSFNVAAWYDNMSAEKVIGKS